MYQHLSVKSGRQVWPRAGNFLDLPARRAGTVLHFVSIAVYNTCHVPPLCVLLALQELIIHN